MKGHAMKNPWALKNPWMSLWLSSANAAAGAARGHATAQARRQADGLAAQGFNHMLDFWRGGLFTPPMPAAKKRKAR
jgi:hypothetical protein